MPTKRVLTIQDISCIGKCSLTVALPILSALGVEAAVVPTAVLSTHTQFKGFTFRDLTDDMDPIREHWIKEGFHFDAIYTGYLGSIRQIDIVKSYFDTFTTNSAGSHTLRIVDPAMADCGRLYTGFDDEFAKAMAKLCSGADIILPNISEAALMLGVEYPGEEAGEETLKELLRGLLGLGCKTAVITGVQLGSGNIGIIGLDGATGEYFSYGSERVPHQSHGTGDIFSSAFTGTLLAGRTVLEALSVAHDYTAACIRNTFEDPDHVDYGVNFEAEIPYLLARARP